MDPELYSIFNDKLFIIFEKGQGPMFPIAEYFSGIKDYRRTTGQINRGSDRSSSRSPIEWTPGFYYG